MTRKYAAATLHIIAIDLYIVVAIRPVLFMEKAQTMQQLMHDSEFGVPTRYFDSLTGKASRKPARKICHPDNGRIVSIAILNDDLVCVWKATIIIWAVPEVHVGLCL